VGVEGKEGGIKEGGGIVEVVVEWRRVVCVNKIDRSRTLAT
jgi:hypothetical protein